MCNSAAGFDRCVNMLRNDIQGNFQILHQELGKEGRLLDHLKQGVKADT